MDQLTVGLDKAGVGSGSLATPAPRKKVESPSFGKRIFDNDQVISFLRMVINPSRAMRKKINAFLKDRSDRRYLFFVAERSLATFKCDNNVRAEIGRLERDEADDARTYRVYDLRHISQLEHRTSAGIVREFTRRSETEFDRIEYRS